MRGVDEKMRVGRGRGASLPFRGGWIVVVWRGGLGVWLQRGGKRTVRCGEVGVENERFEVCCFLSKKAGHLLASSSPALVQALFSQQQRYQPAV